MSIYQDGYYTVPSDSATLTSMAKHLIRELWLGSFIDSDDARVYFQAGIESPEVDHPARYNEASSI
jgi:hypothetical protein